MPVRKSPGAWDILTTNAATHYPNGVHAYIEKPTPGNTGHTEKRASILPLTEEILNAALRRRVEIGGETSQTRKIRQKLKKLAALSPRQSIPEADEVFYLVVKFPIRLTLREMLKSLVRAVKDYARAWVNLPEERLSQLLKENMRLPMRQAVRNIGDSLFSSSSRTMGEIMKAAQKRRGPGSDLMQAALQRRDAWARRKFVRLLREGSRPWAVETLQRELGRKNFGIWKGAILSRKTIRKIVHGIVRHPQSK